MNNEKLVKVVSFISEFGKKEGLNKELLNNEWNKRGLSEKSKKLNIRVIKRVLGVYEVWEKEKRESVKSDLIKVIGDKKYSDLFKGYERIKGVIGKSGNNYNFEELKDLKF